MKHPLVNDVQAVLTCGAEDVAGIDGHRVLLSVGEPKTKPRVQQPCVRREAFVMLLKRGKDVVGLVGCGQGVFTKQRLADFDQTDLLDSQIFNDGLNVFAFIVDRL